MSITVETAVKHIHTRLGFYSHNYGPWIIHRNNRKALDRTSKGTGASTQAYIGAVYSIESHLSHGRIGKVGYRILGFGFGVEFRVWASSRSPGFGFRFGI